MDISVTYNLTFPEYHSAARFVRLHLMGKSIQPHHRALAKSGFVLLLVVLLLMLACYLFAGIHFDRSQGILIALVALLMGMFYLPFMERQWDRRMYKDQKWGEPIELTVREEHISITLPDSVEVRVPWRSFSYIESETMLVLLSPTKMILLPKLHFSQNALDRVRTIVPPSQGKL